MEKTTREFRTVVVEIPADKLPMLMKALGSFVMEAMENNDIIINLTQSYTDEDTSLNPEEPTLNSEFIYQVYDKELQESVSLVDLFSYSQKNENKSGEARRVYNALTRLSYEPELREICFYYQKSKGYDYFSGVKVDGFDALLTWIKNNPSMARGIGSKSIDFLSDFKRDVLDIENKK